MKGAGIEPATSSTVLRWLYHCATAPKHYAITWRKSNEKCFPNRSDCYKRCQTRWWHLQSRLMVWNKRSLYGTIANHRNSFHVLWNWNEMIKSAFVWDFVPPISDVIAKRVLLSLVCTWFLGEQITCVMYLIYKSKEYFCFVLFFVKQFLLFFLHQEWTNFFLPRESTEKNHLPKKYWFKLKTWCHFFFILIFII